ncbi:hypothetical protein [Prochlorococcus marinus]|uniref:hypothetical protein n=1 Tax=Prochlorococcus marinus TaxID=1219 RepID=UPI001ADC79F4|nr:hypothetical protein [Prochlorococcus marinus]MBO8205149.1 hypothetical protein [Prochlorococcus marinus CUG1415]MBW3044412.1 hypothetical protein [Prochlorococcus marinus str. MU1415]
MRKLLIPLLAAFALPTAVNAESYWLLLKVGVSRGAFEKIEMGSMEQCEEQGENFKSKNKYHRYYCLIGK